ncbi:MAG: PEP-CTERM system TPR-repeat protein PrsT [Halioglobus sp.]
MASRLRGPLLCLSLLLLAACGSDRTGAEYIASAKDHLDNLDYAGAIVELQNALQVDGNLAEARWILGKIYLESGQILPAEKELLRAQALGWAADDVRPALAETLLLEGRFAAVQEVATGGLGAAAAAQVLASQALAALSAGDLDRAGELVTQALSGSPGSVEALLAQATVAIHRGDPAGALATVDGILATAPDNPQAWGVKGQALLRQQKLEAARTAFDKAIALSKFALAERVARALINLQLQDYAAAQADTSELLRIFPRNPAGNYLQGLLQFQDRRYRDAINALTLARPASSQFPEVLYYLAMAYLLEGEADLATSFASQFVALAPDNTSGRKLLAALLIKKDRAAEVQPLLQPVLDNAPDDPLALNIMANALLLTDRADAGLPLYARIAQLNPGWLVVPLRGETALLTRSVDEQASAEAAPAAGTANFPQHELLELLGHLGKQDYAAAIAVAKSFHFKDLGSLAPYHVLGMVYLAAGQTAQAREALETALKRAPADPVANQALAQMALASNDEAAARRYYRAVLDKHPNELDTLLQLAALEARNKKADAMVAWLNQAIATNPAALEPRLRLAGHYLGSGRADKVAALFAPLTGLQRSAPRVLEITGLAQLNMHEADAALASFEALVEATGGSAGAHYLAAMAAVGVGDEARVELELQEAVKRDPGHIPSLVNLARIANNRGERARFEQYLATLNRLAPDSPDVLRLQAAALARDDLPGALKAIQRAYTTAPTTETLLELTKLQKAAGRPGDARKSLAAWVRDHPKDVTIRLLLADELLQANNQQGARAQYLAALQVEPDNIVTLNNLAWSLRHASPKKALGYIRRATGIAPGQPELLDTLAVIESLNGNHKAALDGIRRARAAAPQDRSMGYHEAVIRLAAGQAGRAIATLQALLAQDEDEFAERADAEKLLAALEGIAPGKPGSP